MESYLALEPAENQKEGVVETLAEAENERIISEFKRVAGLFATWLEGCKSTVIWLRIQGTIDPEKMRELTIFMAKQTTQAKQLFDILDKEFAMFPLGKDWRECWEGQAEWYEKDAWYERKC